MLVCKPKFSESIHKDYNSNKHKCYYTDYTRLTALLSPLFSRRWVGLRLDESSVLLKLCNGRFAPDTMFTVEPFVVHIVFSFALISMTSSVKSRYLNTDTLQYT